MNNNNTNIDELLNECQQNINNALNLIRQDDSNTTDNTATDNQINELDNLYYSFMEFEDGEKLNCIISQSEKLKALERMIKDEYKEGSNHYIDCLYDITDIYAKRFFELGFSKAIKLMTESYKYKF